MAFSVTVPPVVIEASKKFVEHNNLGMRPDNSNGTKEQQLVGVIGQNMMAHALGLPFMQSSTTHDGGVDFVIHGKKLDIKTMGRTVTPKLDYVNNLIASQTRFNVDGYIFASLNTLNDKLTICGWLPKATFLWFAKFYEKGTIRERTNGTAFELKADTYEIENEDLIHKVYNWNDLFASIKTSKWRKLNVKETEKLLNWDAHYVGIKATKERQQNSITLDELAYEAALLLFRSVPFTIEEQIPVFTAGVNGSKRTTASRKKNYLNRRRN